MMGKVGTIDQPVGPRRSMFVLSILTGEISFPLGKGIVFGLVGASSEVIA